jgi:hypothetical protein
MTKLGRRIFSQNIVLRGRLANASWRPFLLDCIVEMGMTTAGEAASWLYPTDEGKGGFGLTVCQPMTESFIVADVWPDHDGAYLHISSCKAFDAEVLAPIIQAIGLGVYRFGQQEVLSL